MSKKWLSKNKKDYFYAKSKEDGFRARAVYKITQINDEFGIFTRGTTKETVKGVLDLGAAPGSWIQGVLSVIGNENPKILGVDVKRMGEIPGARMVTLNVMSEQMENEIESFFDRGIDLVLSDMSPKISGNKEIDTGKTLDLVNRAIVLARKYLNKGGNFVSKIFQYAEMNEIINDLKQDFNIVQAHKPKASRQGNREMYIIALGYKMGERKKGAQNSKE